IRIALNEKASSTAKKLSQFAQMNSFTYEEVRSKDASIYEALDKGLADVALSNDMIVPEGYRIISKFFPEPFYFATTKGNTELVSELNNALVSIVEANPTFESTLYNRYFAADNNKFILNDEEKEYIKKNPVIQVLTRDNQAPVQYAESGQVKGVAKDILDIVEEKTGVRFEYTIAKDYDEFKRLNESGKYDILIGLPYEMKVGETFNVTLTNPYISGNLVLLANKSIDPNHLDQYTEGKTPYTFKEYNMNQRTNSKLYDSPEEILFAIEQGDVQYTYLNSFIATYYISKNNLKDVATFTVPDYLKSQYSYGVKKSDDLIMLGVLNKMIGSMNEDLNSLIYKNASIERAFSVINLIKDNLVISLISLFVTVAVIITIIYRYYTHQLKMKRAVELEYKRYQMLYDITGEMTFAYNYLKDELKISNSGLNKLANESVINDFSKREFNEENANQVANVIHQYLMKQEDVSCELELMLVNGEKNWYQFTMKLVSDVDKSSQQAVYAIGKVLDIQKDKIEKEALKHNSMTDVLTGIWNRAGAQEKISKKLLNQDVSGALIMLDLDNFKDVNDHYGHLDGDVVLQQIADVLTRVYKDAIVARLGGDEFIIFVENVDKQSISTLCNEALRDIEELPYSREKNI
ncbi:MAG: GGDEF domain-containing protein, partial [Coprobacillus sp.]